MPSCRDKIGLRKLVLTLCLGVLLPTLAQPVRAEVRVSGQADAVIVETREASVEEVLAALRVSFKLNYRTSGALNRVVTGTYTGTLQRVIARLLEGHNYVMQSSAAGGELIVVGPGEAGNSVSASRRVVVADASHQKLPGPPIAPPQVPNANSATNDTSADTKKQTMAPLPHVTLGAVMPPIPTASAAGDAPAVPSVKTSLLPAPAPNPESNFGPPMIPLTAGFPIPQPVPAGTIGP